MDNKSEQVEKDFYKTKLGKVMKIIGIIGFVLGIIGLIIAIFEAIVYAKDLDVYKYQPIINFGNSALTYGMICILVDSMTHMDFNIKNKK